MVSKTSVQEPKKAVKKPAPKKVSSKAAATKKPAIKKVEEKVLDKQIPIKENVNPVEQVLEIKAHNEEKKASKKAAKTVKKAVKTTSAPVERKENKAAVKRDEVLAVKNSAQQAAARKLAEIKADLSAKSKCCCCKDGAWAAWARAYKNIFNYKGRTSRYEFWSFTLINLFFALIFGIGGALLLSEFVSLTVGILYFSVFLIVSVFVGLSICVRRIHDTGHTAWKGFYRPLVYAIFAFIVTVIMCGIAVAYDKQNYEPSSLSWYVSLSGLLIAFTILIICYYSTKIGIVVSYYESDEKDNEYGKVVYNDERHKMLGLKYTVWCLVIISTISFIAGLISGYMKAAQGL